MEPVVHTQGLTKRYGDTLALDALDLEVQAGVHVGLVPTHPFRGGSAAIVLVLAALSGAAALLLFRRRDVMGV